MNAPTIIALIVLAGIVASVVAIFIIDRKNGKGGCSCGCSNCASKDLCHQKKKDDEEN